MRLAESLPASPLRPGPRKTCERCASSLNQGAHRGPGGYFRWALAPLSPCLDHRAAGHALSPETLFSLFEHSFLTSAKIGDLAPNKPGTTRPPPLKSSDLRHSAEDRSVEVDDTAGQGDSRPGPRLPASHSLRTVGWAGGSPSTRQLRDSVEPENCPWATQARGQELSWGTIHRTGRG